MKGVVGGIGAFKFNKIELMASYLTHRGKCSISENLCWSLGQLSTLNCEPFDAGSIIVVSDARIDNIDELNLGINYKIGSQCFTNKVIAFAYLKYGEKAFEKIKGDFAIVIINKINNEIVLVRDHMGVRPLYYSIKPNEFLIFASEPKALLNAGLISNEINEEKKTEYLQWPSDLRTYTKETIYKNILTVLPATYLKVSLNLKKKHECFYWKIDSGILNRFIQKDDIIAEYKRVFINSVSKRLRSKTGFQISGGLDSSSVLSVAKQLLDKDSIFTYHFFPKTEDSDEREFVAEVVAMGSPNHLNFHRKVSTPESIAFTQSIIDRPDFSTVPNALKSVAELDWFSAKKVETVLTGHDGDTVIDKGLYFFINRIKDKDLDFLKEFYRKIGLRSYNSLFVFEKAFTEVFQGSGLVRLLELILFYFQNGLFSIKNLLHFGKVALILFVKNIFKNKYVISREKSFVPSGLTELQQDHFRRIQSAAIVELNEIQNLLGASKGIEYAHPFLDKDFIELSILIPEEYRLDANGLDRNHFREAMQGILPQKIRTRKSKVNFDLPILLNLKSTVALFLKSEPQNPKIHKKWRAAEKEISLIIKSNSKSKFNATIKKYQRDLFYDIWEKQQAFERR